MADTFDPNNVNLTEADPIQVVCYLQAGQNEYNGNLPARVSAVFVILVISWVATLFPVVSRRSKWLKIPLSVYLFARYFGAGVIIATAFIQ
jgi:zinc transporter 1/2/3